MVHSPFIAETDERNQDCRCQVKREQPFRSTTNDVSQSCATCNVDFQFLSCAPPEPFEDTTPSRADDAIQIVLTQANDVGQDVQKMQNDKKIIRRRLTKKGPHLTKQHGLYKKHKNEHKWFYACSSLHPRDKPLLQSFASAFRKAYAMDFYITKYQGKMMESLTPLFQTMTSGIHRLEAQEAQEAEELKKVKFQNTEGNDALPFKKTQDTRRPCSTSTASVHSFGFHGKSMLLAFRYRSRDTHTHWRRLFAIS